MTSISLKGYENIPSLDMSPGLGFSLIVVYIILHYTENVFDVLFFYLLIYFCNYKDFHLSMIDVVIVSGVDWLWVWYKDVLFHDQTLCL